MKLEIGKKYKNRLGHIVEIGPLRRDDQDSVYCFQEVDSIATYLEDGRYHHLRNYHERDLIEEVIEIFEFEDGEKIKQLDKVRFLDQVGEVTSFSANVIRVSFKEQVLSFGKNKKLLGFENENLLEIVKDEYQVYYSVNGFFNTTSEKVRTLTEARRLIERDNGTLANPRKVIGLIDRNGKLNYTVELEDGKE